MSLLLINLFLNSLLIREEFQKKFEKIQVIFENIRVNFKNIKLTNKLQSVRSISSVLFILHRSNKTLLCTPYDKRFFR